MAKKRNKIERTPVDCAWGLFQNTGDIGYYLLYRKLVDKRNKGE